MPSVRTAALRAMPALSALLAACSSGDARTHGSDAGASNGGGAVSGNAGSGGSTSGGSFATSPSSQGGAPTGGGAISKDGSGAMVGADSGGPTSSGAGAGTDGGGAGNGGAGNGGASTGDRANTGGASNGGASNGGASTGGRANTGGASTGGAGGGAGSCISAPLLNALGKDSVLVGASMGDATAKAAPFDLRYLYLSSGIFDGTSVCQRCDTGCSSMGQSCANGGCAWWGCWQNDQDPPGAYATGFFSTDKWNGQIPMITYYQAFQASGATEGSGEVAAMADAAFTERYLTDFRFLVGLIGNASVFLHIEPDFWAYAEQVNSNPHAIKAAVASAYSGCTGFENSIAGLGACMIDIVHKNAPNAKVGLHGSSWGTNVDVLMNKSASLDVAGEAKKLGAFLTACGAGASDFVVVDAVSDRDAGYYDTVGKNTWWDATNATLPNFHQAFAWAGALAEAVGKPVIWWQLPVGNETLTNKTNAWKDNRVDYFMTHLAEVAASHGVAIAFGAGRGDQTTPESDGGHLVGLVKAEAASGRTKACP